MRKIPTDLEILNAIYARYYDDFVQFTKRGVERTSKIHVPIDIEAVAKDMNVDPDIIFGRLYYHLNRKHGYKDDQGVHVDLFSMRVGGDRHCIQFPLMASVLSNLRTENRKFRIATSMAAISLLISVVSFILSVVR